MQYAIINLLNMFYWISYNIFKLISKLFLPYTIIGKENVPEKGGFILASNHLSYLDPLMVGISCDQKISYMARDSLFRNKFFGGLIRLGHAFPVKRNTADIGALREAIRRLKGGEPVLLFPEGSRQAVKGQGKVESGIGFIAIKAGVPLIPVKITGTDKALPPGAKWFKKHSMTLEFGKPIFSSPQDTYEDVARRIMQQIYSI